MKKTFVKMLVISTLFASFAGNIYAQDLSDRVSERLDNVKIGSHKLEITNWRGDLTLKGKVSSLKDKQIVIQTARSVDGVDKIIDELSIDNSFETKARTSDQMLDSEQISRVKDLTERFLASQSLKGSHSLQYISNDDGITVKGELPSGTDKSGLIQYWKEKIDVKVTDLIDVRPWPADNVLKARVETELADKLKLNINTIGVNVENGIVTLTGHRSNHFEADQLATAVWMIEGVRGLNSQVTFDGNRDDPMSVMQKR